ncbi:hypothetical protein ACSVDA_10945 [Cytobacillus sp. Hm23]
MKNVVEKGVKITLDKERILKYDLNSLVEIEEKYGKEGLTTVINKVKEGKLKDIRFLLYCGLIHEDDELTEKKVGALFDFTNIQGIATTLMSAFVQSLPEPEEEAKNK